MSERTTPDAAAAAPPRFRPELDRDSVLVGRASHARWVLILFLFNAVLGWVVMVTRLANRSGPPLEWFVFFSSAMLAEVLAHRRAHVDFAAGRPVRAAYAWDWVAMVIPVVCSVLTRVAPSWFRDEGLFLVPARFLFVWSALLGFHAVWRRRNFLRLAHLAALEETFE